MFSSLVVNLSLKNSRWHYGLLFVLNTLEDQLYEEGGSEDDGFGDDDSDDDDNAKAPVDASTMTAADFFGKPDKDLIKRYKEEQKGGGNKGVKKNKGFDDDDEEEDGGKNGKKGKKKATLSFRDDDDADSWDEHNFEEGGMDWKEGDGDDDDDVDDDDVGEGEDDIEDEQMIGKDEEGDDGDEDSGENKKLSAHEIQSEKLRKQTLQLEQDMMSEKPWKMMGEAKGADRATDSLLDSTPEFEVAFKPPPILTPEHTASIEEMIKRRIVDEDYDDVVPRELPDIGASKRGDGSAPEVSQEKSKLGLGELYEREYLKKTTGYDRTEDEKRTELDAAKEEMKTLFANLCSQLDALSNYHFAPRPVADEADVANREDVPAIAMEEVLPLHVSQSRAAAPEEVFAGGKGRKSVLKGESELDQVRRSFGDSIVLGQDVGERSLTSRPPLLLSFNARPGRAKEAPPGQEGCPPQGPEAEERGREAHIEAPAGPRPQQPVREAQAPRGAAGGPCFREGCCGGRRQERVRGRGGDGQGVPDEHEVLSEDAGERRTRCPRRWRGGRRRPGEEEEEGTGGGAGKQRLQAIELLGRGRSVLLITFKIRQPTSLLLHTLIASLHAPLGYSINNLNLPT